MPVGLSAVGPGKDGAGSGGQRRRFRRAVARRQHRRLGVAGQIQVLRPVGLGEAAQLLPANGEDRKGLRARQALQRLYIGCGGDGFFAERHAAPGEQGATGGAGLALRRGVQRHRKARGRLLELFRPGGVAIRGGAHAGGRHRRDARGGIRWRAVRVGDATIGADDAVQALGGGGWCQRQGQRQSQRQCTQQRSRHRPQCSVAARLKAQPQAARRAHAIP